MANVAVQSVHTEMSPSALLTQTVVAVFAVEMAVMAVLAERWWEAMLDAGMVAATTWIAGHLLMARPLKTVLERLRASESRFHAVFDVAPIGVAVAQPDGTLQQANHAFQAMTGYSEAELVERGWRGITHPDDLAANVAHAEAIRANIKNDYRLEKRYVRKDGSVFWAELTVAAVRARDGAVSMLVALAKDISDRHQIEQLQRLALRLFRASGDAMMLTDSNRRMLTVNKAFTRVTGYTPREALGQTPRLLASGRHDDAFYARMWRELDETGHWHGTVWNRRKDGCIYPQRLTITALIESEGQASHYVAVFRDASDEHARMDALAHTAHHDPLTGLPNRMLLQDRLAQATEKMNRDGDGLAIFFVDLDGFKAVNDARGHLAGDQVLQQIAQRLRGLLRGSDTVARLGGDEFVLLSLNLAQAAAAEALAAKILDTTQRPIELECGTSVTVGASIGIALFPEDARQPDGLLALADAAMYAAKQAGKNRWCRLEAPRQAAADRETELRAPFSVA